MRDVCLYNEPYNNLYETYLNKQLIEIKLSDLKDNDNLYTENFEIIKFILKYKPNVNLYSFNYIYAKYNINILDLNKLNFNYSINSSNSVIFTALNKLTNNNINNLLKIADNNQIFYLGYKFINNNIIFENSLKLINHPNIIFSAFPKQKNLISIIANNKLITTQQNDIVLQEIARKLNQQIIYI